MKRVIAIVCFITFAIGGFGCGRNAQNTPEETNANVASEDPFADITDPNVALAEGNRLLDEDQTEMAIAAFRRAVKLDPDLADAWFQLGIAYSLLEMQMARSGDVTEPSTNEKEGRTKTNSEKAFEKAVEAYKKLLKANPNDDEAEFNLGRTYVKLLKDEEAADAFKQAVKLDPENGEYLTELGAILIRLARYREAIDPLKKAVALDETNVRAQELLDDAEAGRQRLEYVAPNNTNTANTSKNTNANANVSSNSNSNSNSVPKNPLTNTRPREVETKRPTPPPSNRSDQNREE